MYGRLGAHPFALDLALASTFLAATLLSGVVSGGRHGGTMNAGVILAGVVAYAAALYARHRPAAALAVAVGAATTYMTLSGDHGLVVVAPLIALYQLTTATGDPRKLMICGGGAMLALAGVPELVAHLTGGNGPWLDASKLLIAAGCGLALAAGTAARNHRAYLAAVEERARSAERDREREAERRVTEERLRIARDLHDSLGHHIALINAQAGMATHVFGEQPDAARQALTHIRHASRAALEDLRETVGLLRRPEEPAAPTEPQAGIDGVDDLVASFRKSGLRIDHAVEGSLRPLPPAADLTAYRVVQEALTNVRKHADAAATTRVRLSFQPAALRILVENNGAGIARNSAVATGGHGIVGMRERVTAIGGRLEAGARPSGGFRVSAELPLAPGDRP